MKVYSCYTSTLKITNKKLDLMMQDESCKIAQINVDCFIREYYMKFLLPCNVIHGL